MENAKAAWGHGSCRWLEERQVFKDKRAEESSQAQLSRRMPRSCFLRCAVDLEAGDAPWLIQTQWEAKIQYQLPLSPRPLLSCYLGTNQCVWWHTAFIVWEKVLTRKWPRNRQPLGVEMEGLRLSHKPPQVVPWTISSPRLGVGCGVRDVGILLHKATLHRCAGWIANVNSSSAWHFFFSPPL